MTQHWKFSAACAGADPELFFPIARNPTEEQLGEARAYCDECEVRPACLDYALGLYERGDRAWGLWAGTTEAQRDLILAQRRAADKAEAAAG